MGSRTVQRGDELPVIARVWPPEMLSGWFPVGPLVAKQMGLSSVASRPPGAPPSVKTDDG